MRPLLLSLLCLCATGCMLNSRGSGGELGDASADALSDGASDQSHPDGDCPSGSKLCNNACVAVTDPAWGCGSEACGPACSTKHGAPKCSNGACKVDHCDDGWGDCDALGENGCETDLHTLAHCGACGAQCAIAHGSGSCSSGVCAVLACDTGFVDCNADPSDGCEGDLKSPENCGQCGHKCEVPGGGVPSCTAGVCSIATCPWETGDCNADPSDGCETPTNTVTHCGQCNALCQLPNAVTACVAGSCVIQACEVPFGDCDGSPATGCEIDISQNPSHCGQCNAPCDPSHASNPSCVAGACHYSCDNGFFDCNGPAPGASDDGCESQTAVDPANCGACGRPCSNVSVDQIACSGGVCASTCTGPVSNCSKPVAPAADDGCESDVLTSPDHCGGCGAPCEPSNTGARICVAGTCAPQCLPGFADCNGPAPGLVDDGCEIDTKTDAAHCGACATPCALVNAAGAVCADSLCSFSCLAGFADCNAPQPASSADGCEKNINTDTANCGGCGQYCGSNHVATVVCAAGACAPVCQAGWADCDHSGPSLNGNNGCEQDVFTDATHCGGCGRACSGDHVATKSCSGGKCDSSCDATWKNCTKPSYPNSDDGCETWGAICW